MLRRPVRANCMVLRHLAAAILVVRPALRHAAAHSVGRDAALERLDLLGLLSGVDGVIDARWAEGEARDTEGPEFAERYLRAGVQLALRALADLREGAGSTGLRGVRPSADMIEQRVWRALLDERGKRSMAEQGEAAGRRLEEVSTEPVSANASDIVGGNVFGSEEWWQDKETSYALFMLVAIGSVLFLVCCLETTCLRSTLLGSHLVHAVVQAETKFESAATAAGRRISAVIKPDLTEVQVIRVTPSHKRGNTFLSDWTDTQREEFWANMEKQAMTRRDPAEMTKRRRMMSKQPTRQNWDVVAFRQQTFPAMEAKGVVTIHLTRIGRCSEVVDVLVGTSEPPPSCFMAQAGKDFVEMQTVVRFEPFQTTASFEVKLLQTDVWSTTRFFLVSLKRVVSDNALLGGPSIATWGTDEDDGPTARVAILQADVFPCNIPQHRMDDPSGLWLMYYYLKDRIKERGKHFWKTLFGRMYNPVHNVLVTVYVRKLLIDWACEPAAGGSHRKAIIVTLVQFASLVILRWGDQMQTMNRGRTGAVRMLHRRQLLQKLMMIDHKETYEVHPTVWFYNALLNVESATVMGYWQAYEISMNGFALLLCLLATFVDPLHGWKVNQATLVPSLGIVIIVPISISLVMRRRERLAELLEQRMDGETAWVETFSWMCRSARDLYSLGPRELAHIESLFVDQTNQFLSRHVIARDLTNDSAWVTRWLGAIGYLMVMLWGAFRLLQEKTDGSDEYTTGDYVLLLSVYLKFGRYLNAVNMSIVKMQTAAVSIRRLAALLNLQENRSLYKDEADIELRMMEPLPEDVIELRNVRLTFPENKPGGLGPMGPINVPLNVRIPLGHLVTIHGGTEPQRMSFMAVVARILLPTEGEVLTPHHTWTVMMPAVPAELPKNLTVQETLALAGAPNIVAHSFAQVLELDPEKSVEVLAPGETQLLAIARAMLRDPEVLVLIRPFAFVATRHRTRLGRLLRVWQMGGAEGIVETLLRLSGRCLKVHDERVRPRARTLIVAGMGIPGGVIPGEASNDFSINLDKLGMSSSTYSFGAKSDLWERAWDTVSDVSPAQFGSSTRASSPLRFGSRINSPAP